MKCVPPPFPCVQCFGYNNLNPTPPMSALINISTTLVSLLGTGGLF